MAGGWWGGKSPELGPVESGFIVDNSGFIVDLLLYSGITVYNRKDLQGTLRNIMAKWVVMGEFIEGYID